MNEIQGELKKIIHTDCVRKKLVNGIFIPRKKIEV